jgi:hypothetical protein
MLCKVQAKAGNYETNLEMLLRFKKCTTSQKAVPGYLQNRIVPVALSIRTQSALGTIKWAIP